MLVTVAQEVKGERHARQVTVVTAIHAAHLQNNRRALAVDGSGSHARCTMWKGCGSRGWLIMKGESLCESSKS
jgi:hypothetical protein